MTETLIGLAAMMLLSLVRIPIALSMGIVGVVGYAYMRDWNWAPAFAMAQTQLYETGRNYTLSVVPLFILMGTFVARAGMAEELFRAAYAFVGHRRGGLAMATVVAAAGFGGPCGSSIATAATMAKVAYPSMKKFGYADYLSTGSIAAGGTLGILIPPSTMMVIYGIITQTCQARKSMTAAQTASTSRRRTARAPAPSILSMKSMVTCSSACDTSGRPAKMSTSSISSVISNDPLSGRLKT